MNIFKKICVFLIIFCSIKLSFCAFELPFNRYYGRVKNKRINVRARPSTSSEIMYQLEKGENILVIGESGDWVQFRPKEGYFAWIHKDMVEDGLVAKNNVNVRVGPSLSNSILGKLSEGDPVMEIKTDADWIQIEMPRKFGFWAAKFLIKFLCPEHSFQEYILNEKEAREYFKKAEAFRRKEFTKRYLDVDHNTVIKMYQEIIDKYPDTTESIKAHERIIDAREKKAMTNQKKVTMNELRRVLRLFDEAESSRKDMMLNSKFTKDMFEAVVAKYQYIVKNYGASKEGRKSLERLEELETLKKGKQSEWKRLGGVSFHGKVKSYKSLTYPEATHILVKGGFKRKVLCAFFNNKVDFRAYEKRKVIIKGSILKEHTEDADYPLVEVESIALQ